MPVTYEDSSDMPVLDDDNIEEWVLEAAVQAVFYTVQLAMGAIEDEDDPIEKAEMRRTMFDDVESIIKAKFDIIHSYRKMEGAVLDFKARLKSLIG